MNKLLLLALSIFTLSACTKSTDSATTYFTYPDSIEAAGVKMIPIQTPSGTFKVWTKRFGTNPKIKILLLHGGPAMTHEYMECFETFSKERDSNSTNMTNWGRITVINLRIRHFGKRSDLWRKWNKFAKQ